MKGGRKGQGIVCYETFPNSLGIRISPIKLPLTLNTKVFVVLFLLMVRGSKKEKKKWTMRRKRWVKGGRKCQGIVCYETFPNLLGIIISPIKLPLTLSTKVIVVLFFQMVQGAKKEKNKS